MNPNVIPATRAAVDAALLLLEHVDIPAANLVRGYLAELESAVRAAELESDDDWELESGEQSRLQRLKERLMERIREERHVE